MNHALWGRCWTRRCAHRHYSPSGVNILQHSQARPGWVGVENMEEYNKIRTQVKVTPLLWSDFPTKQWLWRTFSSSKTQELSFQTKSCPDTRVRLSDLLLPPPQPASQQPCFPSPVKNLETSSVCSILSFPVKNSVNFYAKTMSWTLKKQKSIKLTGPKHS